MPTPEEFKAKILQRYPNGVASDGTPYKDMDATELTRRVVQKYPDGVTNEGIRYADYLSTSTKPSVVSSAVSNVQDVATKSFSPNFFEGDRGQLPGVVKDVLGMGPQEQNPGFLGGLFQSTLGSKGVAGLVGAIPQTIAARVYSARAANKNSAIQNASMDLAHTTDELIKLANALPPDDPLKQHLIDQANANIKKFNFEDAGNNVSDVVNGYGGKYANRGIGTSVKDVAGTALNAALTVGTFGIGGGGQVAKSAITKALELAPGATRYAKYLSYGKNLIPRMVESGTIGSAYQAASNLIEGKPITENVATTGLLSAAIPAVTEGLARGVKNVASVFSGVPTKVFEAAYKNPDAIGKVVKRFASDPAFGENQLLSKTRLALQEVRNQRSLDYQKGLKEIEDAYRKTNLTSRRSGVATYQINKTADQGGGELFKLSKQGVQQRITNVLDGFGVKVKNGTLDFSNSTLADSEESLVKKMLTTVKDWDNISPTGLNDLAIKLGKFGQGRFGTPISTIATQAKKGARDYLAERVPEVIPLNKAYAESSQFVDDIVREIGQAMNGKGSKAIAVSRLTQLFTKGSPQRQQLVQQLGERGGQDLVNEIMGATLAKWGPNWSRRIIEALGIAGGSVVAELAGASAGAIGVGGVATAGLASPRIGGSVARVAGTLKPVSQAIKKLAIPGITRK